jgi:hypothetical protein
MTPVVLCQVGFAPCVSDREQAIQANRIERTISISSVRKRRWRRKNHRVASLQGDLQRIGESSAKMFNYAHCCLIFFPGAQIRQGVVPPGSCMDVVGLVCRLSSYSEGHSVVAQFFSCVFRPKNTCQAPKRTNLLPFNNIRVAF